MSFSFGWVLYINRMEKELILKISHLTSPKFEIFKIFIFWLSKQLFFKKKLNAPYFNAKNKTIDLLK